MSGMLNWHDLGFLFPVCVFPNAGVCRHCSHTDVKGLTELLSWMECY